MIDTVSFFTPVIYEGVCAASNWVEEYFALGSEVVVIDANSKARFADRGSSCLTTALKIVSYITIILPLVMLLMKACIRASMAITFEDQPTEHNTINVTAKFHLNNLTDVECSRILYMNCPADLSEEFLAQLCHGNRIDRFTHLKSIVITNLGQETPLQTVINSNFTNEMIPGHHHIDDTRHQRVVQLLNSGEALVHQRDSQHKTPLHLAVQRGMVNVVRLLLSKGAEVNTQDVNDNTPLHEAVTLLGVSRKRVVEMLMDRGANPNVTNSFGQTPLHEAVSCVTDDSGLEDQLETVKVLVEGGAEINRINSEGRTPLLSACSEPMIEFLISKGAVGEVTVPINVDHDAICDSRITKIIIQESDQPITTEMINELEKSLYLWVQPWKLKYLSSITMSKELAKEVICYWLRSPHYYGEPPFWHRLANLMGIGHVKYYEQYKDATIKLQRFYQNRRVEWTVTAARRCQLSEELFSQAKAYIDQQTSGGNPPTPDPLYLKQLSLVFWPTSPDWMNEKPRLMEAKVSSRRVCDSFRYRHLTIPGMSDYGGYWIESHYPIPSQSPDNDRRHLVKAQMILYKNHQGQFTQAIEELFGFQYYIMFQCDIWNSDRMGTCGKYDNLGLYIDNNVGKIALAVTPRSLTDEFKPFQHFQVRLSIYRLQDVCESMIRLFPYHFDKILEIAKKLNPAIERERWSLEHTRDKALEVFDLIP